MQPLSSSSLLSGEVTYLPVAAAPGTSALTLTCRPHHPFEEAVISWNGRRPREGAWELALSFESEAGWSPWIPYATWGAQGQAAAPASPSLKIDTLLTGAPATALRLRLTSASPDALSGLRSLHVTSTPRTLPARASPRPPLDCSPPTGPLPDGAGAPRQETALLPHLGRHRAALPRPLDRPLGVAARCRDATHALFGHWPFNVAAASDAQAPATRCGSSCLDSVAPSSTSSAEAIPRSSRSEGPSPEEPSPTGRATSWC